MTSNIKIYTNFYTNKTLIRIYKSSDTQIFIHKPYVHVANEIHLCISIHKSKFVVLPQNTQIV